jgi:hypothetical protein
MAEPNTSPTPASGQNGQKVINESKQKAKQSLPPISEVFTIAEDEVKSKDLSEPDFDIFTPEVLPPKLRIEEWLHRIGELDWGEDDSFQVERAINSAFEIATKLDLSALTVLGRRSGATTYLAGRVLARAVEECPSCAEDEIRQMINRAIISTGVRRDGRPSKETRKLPEAYYDPSRFVYWAKNIRGDFQQHSTDSFRRLLNNAGLSPKAGEDGVLSEIDAHLVRIEQEHSIDLAGEFAGYPRGLHHANGYAFLVTKEIELIQPVPGAWPVIDGLLSGLLGNEQKEFLMAHLKVSYESLRDHVIDCGLTPIIVGPQDSGKSLVLKGIINPLLGGREAKAYRFLLGRTAFNADLQRAECWAVDDEEPINTYEARRTLAGAIKNICGTTVVRCEAKQINAANVPLFKRLFMCINESDMDCLPELNNSVLDKLLLLKARSFVMPEGLPPLPATTDEKQAFLQRVRTELPHFIHDLVNWKLPGHLQGRRFQVKAYAHPDLLEPLTDTSPDQELWSLIQEILFHGRVCLENDEQAEVSQWKGDVVTLKSILLASEKRSQVEWFCRTATVLGTRLGMLRQVYPDHVMYPRTATKRFWIIKRYDPASIQPDDLGDNPRGSRRRGGRANLRQSAIRV